jgi:hypothetical protein
MLVECIVQLTLKFSAEPFLCQCTSTTVRLPLSCTDTPINTQVYDTDSEAEMKANLDDDQELSMLAQIQPSTFQATISCEVCPYIFFITQTYVNILEAILARGR